MKPIAIVLLLLSPLLFGSGINITELEKIPNPKRITCKGKIVEFAKDGFHAFDLEDGGHWMDLTWVEIKEPKEFEGIRHMLLSQGPEETSPYGKIGAVIEFAAYESTLEAERNNFESITIDREVILEMFEEITNEDSNKTIETP